MVPADASCPRDPRRCQGDARFQPRMISGSVNPAKVVRTGCPETPSDGFVSHGPKDQSVALCLSQIAYLPLCVKALFYSVRSSAPLFNGGKTFWLVMMSLR